MSPEEKAQRKAEKRRIHKRNYMRRYMRRVRRRAKEVRRVQAWRKRKKAEVKAVWHAANKARRDAVTARRIARQERKAFQLRKHATAPQGFCDGFQSTAPKSDAELKTLSYTHLYRTGYEHGCAEKLRVQTLVAAQQHAAAQPKPVLTIIHF